LPVGAGVAGAVVDGVAVARLAVVVEAWLGGEADTSAANPALKPADPRIAQRRACPTRARAASRAAAA